MAKSPRHPTIFLCIIAEFLYILIYGLIFLKGQHTIIYQKWYTACSLIILLNEGIDLYGEEGLHTCTLLLVGPLSIRLFTYIHMVKR